MPTRKIISVKPRFTPSRCGTLRRKPKFRPEDASITLFGPGVIELTSANIASGPSRDSDIRGTSAQLVGSRFIISGPDDGTASAGDHDDHGGGKEEGCRFNGFLEQQGRRHDREERLQQLHLADPGDAAHGQAAVPGEKAQEHGAERQVGAGEHDRGAGPAGLRRHPAHREGHDGGADHQRPAYCARAAQRARYPRAFGVAHPAQHHRHQQPEVAQGQCVPWPWRIGRDQRGAHQGPGPEGRRRTLAAAQRGEGRGRQRQQSVEHRAVRRGHGLHGEGRGQRPAHDDAQRGEDHAGPLLAVRPARARQPEQGGSGHRCHQRLIFQADQQRLQVGHGQARHGQRQRKRPAPQESIGVAFPGRGRRAGPRPGRRGRKRTGHDSHQLRDFVIAATLRIVIGTVPVHFACHS